MMPETKKSVAPLLGATKYIKAEEVLKQSLYMLKETLNGTINIVSLIVEKRDPYTAGHQKRVASLARAIAKKMNLSKDKMEAISISASIHDLGKINTPSEILSKPDNITEAEFSIIKEHPKIGYDIIKVVDFPMPIAEIILQHHERLDGSGYPQGLKEKDILIEAKILVVADVVEAMSSHRPYRPALGIDKALEEIKKKRGIYYDTNVVDACLKVFKKGVFRFIHNF